MDTVTRTLRSWLVPLLTTGIFVFALSACDSGPSSIPDNLPADHTANNDGIPHRPGFQTPFAPSSGCTTCHGADLRGGTAVIDGMDIATPSCFSCHGNGWSSSS